MDRGRVRSCFGNEEWFSSVTLSKGLRWWGREIWTERRCEQYQMWERGCELTSIPTDPRDCRAAGAFASLGSSAGPVVDALDLRGGIFGLALCSGGPYGERRDLTSSLLYRVMPSKRDVGDATKRDGIKLSAISGGAA